MSNDLTLFGGNGSLPAPAYMADIFGGTSNIPPKLSVPQLSMKGKHFRVILDGEETIMTRKDTETGEDTPVSSVKLVVLNMSKRSARTYYSKGYDPANVAPPDCFSLDGEHPDISVQNPPSKTCASCPMAVKGSKISAASGKAITACTMQRRLVVIPAAKLDFEPLLMRLAPTSAWDKNNETNEGQGWYAWQQYLDFIAARNVKHTAAIVTMVKFDTTEYPKLLFKPDRFLTQEEAMKVKDVWNSDKVRALLEAKETEAIGSTAVDDEPFETAKPAPAPKPEPKKAEKPKPVEKPVEQVPVTKAVEGTVIGAGLANLLSDWEE